MCCNRLAAIGDRTLFNPHAKSTACGARTREGAAIASNFFGFGRDLRMNQSVCPEKPVSTLRKRRPSGPGHACFTGHDLLGKPVSTLR
jgi:hypothetical protein